MLLPGAYEIVLYPRWQPLRLEIEFGTERLRFVTTTWYNKSVEREVAEGRMVAFERAYGMLVHEGSGLRLRDFG